jgi:hypothetical protein
VVSGIYTQHTLKFCVHVESMKIFELMSISFQIYEIERMIMFTCTQKQVSCKYILKCSDSGV